MPATDAAARDASGSEDASVDATLRGDGGSSEDAGAPPVLATELAFDECGPVVWSRHVVPRYGVEVVPGTELLVAGADRAVTEIDLASAEVRWTDLDPWGGVRDVAVSPDARWLVVGSDRVSGGILARVDRTGAEPARYRTDFSTVRGVRFFPSGDRILVTGTTARFVLDAATLATRRELALPEAMLAERADLTQVATRVDRVLVSVRDLETLEEVFSDALSRTLPSGTSEVAAAGWSADGSRFVAASDDGVGSRLVVYGTDPYEVLAFSSLEQRLPAVVQSLAVSPSGARVAVTLARMGVRVVDASTLDIVYTDPSTSAGSLLWLDADRLLELSASEVVARVHDLRGGAPLEVREPWNLVSIRGTAISPDGSRAAVADGTRLLFVTLDADASTTSGASLGAGVRDVAWPSSAALVVATDADTYRVSASSPHSATRIGAGASRLAVTADGSRALAIGTAGLVVYDAAGALLSSRADLVGDRLAQTSGGSVVAVSNGAALRVVDLVSDEILLDETLDRPITGLSFSADGQLLAVGRADRPTRVLRTTDFAEVAAPNTNPFGATDVAWHPSRALLAILDSSGVSLVAADDAGELVIRDRIPLRGFPRRVALHADRLLVASEEGLLVYQCRSGAP